MILPCCTRCRDCGGKASCADEGEAPPCEHYPLCDDCRLGGCKFCAADEMFSTDTYSEAADPLTTTPVETDAEYRERTRIPGFDTRSNSYHRSPR